MRKATITQTKNQLSALIDAVKEGETILILDRGRPVAKLVPIAEGGPVAEGGADDDGRLASLERAGLVRRAARRPPARLPAPLKLPRGVSVLEALLDDREEGR